MPPASRARAGTAESDPHPDPASDPTLAAERAHLASSREFLRLMREDVLSLRALGGDPVSEEYLKADLYRRVQALHDLPDTPLFFGRLDYAGRPAAGGAGAGPAGGAFAGERFHIGWGEAGDPDRRPAARAG